LDYAYDADNRLTSVKLNGAPVRDYTYKTNGDLDFIKDYREFATSGSAYLKRVYEYDTAGRVGNLSYYDSVNGTDTLKKKYTLGYDDRNFITSETIYDNYGTSAKTTLKTHTYDAIGRLTNSVETVGSQTKTTTYTYDLLGNRKTMTEGNNSFAYDYNQFNQLDYFTQTITGANYSYRTEYGFDSLGNQTSETVKKVQGGTQTTEKQTGYTYDVFNQMTALSVTENGTTKTGQYAYNVEGQRIKKVENGSTTRYYYTGSSILYTTNENYEFQTENILTPDGTIVASKRFEAPFNDQYFFYNYDLRGSTTGVIKPDGTRVVGYEYDEFGNIVKSASTFKNEVAFTGSISDDLSGLHYMNARYYSPKTGRFLQQDTYTGNPYDPWTQHLYNYCGNNPINYIDPTGHRVVDGADSYLGRIDFPTAKPTTVVGGSNPNLPWTYGYRYIDQGEYDAIMKNPNGRYIPNTNKFGDLKDIFTSPNKYNSVDEAVNALKIGSQNPNGKYPDPVYRVRFKYENVSGVKEIRYVEGGKGIEVISKDKIKIDDITKLGNEKACFDSDDDDFDKSNHPKGTGTGGKYMMSDDGASWYEDQYGQRRPTKPSMFTTEGPNTYFGSKLAIPGIVDIPSVGGLLELGGAGVLVY